jgi:hypothetical protein
VGELSTGVLARPVVIGPVVSGGGVIGVDV